MATTRTSVAKIAYVVRSEARRAVLEVLPEHVSFYGTLFAKKQLAKQTILKLEDDRGDTSIDVFFPGNCDDIEIGDRVHVEGACDVRGDERGATMCIVVQARAVKAVSPRAREENHRRTSQPVAAGRLRLGDSAAVPRRIRRLALVTSHGSAAIEDINKTLSLIGEAPEIKLFDCPLMGKGAAEKIAEKIAAARDSDADMILVVRGGDDGHHFRAFKEDIVLNAVEIARVVKPIITGIGHADDTDALEVNRRATHASATPAEAVRAAFRLAMKVRYWQNAIGTSAALLFLLVSYIVISR